MAGARRDAGRLVTLEVLEPGALTTVQDPFGRPLWRHVGVPVGGAVDRWSARLANRLAGNPEDAALLEFALSGPTLAFSHPSTIALVGDFEATADGLPLPAASARAIRPGSVVRIAAGRDALGYLAVAGGLEVPVVLGSSGTDLRTGFGGLEGRAMRSGDRLVIGGRAPGAAQRWTGSAASGPIRVLPGPHIDRVAPGALERERWQIGRDADRTGARLDGPPVHAPGSEIASMGLPEGAVQVPPDGRPIVMLADRPVTGGYPVPWVVIGADVGRIARLRPAAPVSFVTVSVAQARDAWLAAERELAALDPLRAEEDDQPGGWAGSHR